MEVEAIRPTTNGYEVEGRYKNMPADGKSEFGVLLSDITYRNEE